MNLDEQIKNSVANVTIPTPSYEFSIWGLSVFVWNKFEFSLEICETEPYAPDGEVPLIMVRTGWLEFLFYSKLLFKLIYKKRHGYSPRGLE